MVDRHHLVLRAFRFSFLSSAIQSLFDFFTDTICFIAYETPCFAAAFISPLIDTSSIVPVLVEVSYGSQKSSQTVLRNSTLREKSVSMVFAFGVFLKLRFAFFGCFFY